MRIIDDLIFTREDFTSPAVTIGSYDGLHLGHQEIIKRVIERARDEGASQSSLPLSPIPSSSYTPKLIFPLSPLIVRR